MDSNRPIVRAVCARAVVAALAALAAIGCASSPISSTRVEDSLATTFANLVELQVARLALPAMRAPDFAVTAICRRAIGNERGSGEWSCTLVWQGPDRRMLRDTYDVYVATDGCYTARLNGESLGGPTLKRADGTPVRNLLYTFEGCFDRT